MLFPGFYKRLMSFKKKGESKEKFAERIGSSRPQLDRWKKGQTPMGTTIVPIAKKLGTTAKFLMFGENDNIPEETGEFLAFCETIEPPPT